MYLHDYFFILLSLFTSSGVTGRVTQASNLFLARALGTTFGSKGFDKLTHNVVSTWTHHAPVVEIKPPRGDAVFWIRLVGSLERGRLGPACQFVKG